MAQRSAPFDATIPLLGDPYRYISRRTGGTGVLSTRILLEPALLMTGVQAARLFYAPGRFRRAGATPRAIAATLFGKGGVQGLDGPAHVHRKALHLKIIGPDKVAPLAGIAADRVAAHLGAADDRPGQDIFATALAEAVCGWAGVPLDPADAPGVAATLGTIYEGVGDVGPGHLRARRARREADVWAGDLIARVRDGRLNPPPDTALHRVADWRDPDGARLPRDVAAVELGSLLRPFIAISVFLTFAAHALATVPGLPGRLRADASLVPGFVQEVRRHYPFFPFVAARVAMPTTWHGHDLPEGRLTLLDLYGTNRDPSVWDAPETFDPARFGDAAPDPNALVAQGGGVHASGHRCPGEWAAIAVMEAVTEHVLLRLDWSALPEQDLSLPMRAVPALPKDRLRLSRAMLRG